MARLQIGDPADLPGRNVRDRCRARRVVRSCQKPRLGGVGASGSVEVLPRGEDGEEVWVVPERSTVRGACLVTS